MTLDISAIRQRIEKATPENVKVFVECEADGDLFWHAPADLRALCDEVERLRARLTRVYRCESCKFDYHATILERETIPCPTCKAPATRTSVPAGESPKEEGK